MSARRFSPGITVLLDTHREWLVGARVGLVSHQAAVDCAGQSSAELLAQAPDIALKALFGPEHGFFGAAPAGKRVAPRRHPDWGIPVHSLYGSRRRPSPGMLKDIDLLVVDLQTVPARPYTYLATLRYVLEAAATEGKPVIVTDRPISLPTAIDGPLPDPGMESFVASACLPFAYAMTAAETAVWLRRTLALDVDLRIAPMRGYHRASFRQPDWPPWIPPSPEIRAWETAACYPATVFGEALPVCVGRGTALAYQLIGAPWLRAAPCCEQLSDLRLPGIRFHRHPYIGLVESKRPRMIEGLRLVVTNPDTFRPALTATAILSVLQAVHGHGPVWRRARQDFLDALFGTPSVRLALLDGEPPRQIAARWRTGLRRFRIVRTDVLRYEQR